MNVTGSHIQGDNVALAAARDLVLRSAEQRQEQTERNKASSSPGDAEHRAEHGGHGDGGGNVPARVRPQLWLAGYRHANRVVGSGGGCLCGPAGEPWRDRPLSTFGRRPPGFAGSRR
ncbi:hemagglutinin repeat-containing protein [Stenotrophomonas sp. 169]|nr:hemagglutinin repeat-containing protein [Stenotrophomonas sp. 169]